MASIGAGLRAGACCGRRRQSLPPGCCNGRLQTCLNRSRPGVRRRAARCPGSRTAFTWHLVRSSRSEARRHPRAPSYRSRAQRSSAACDAEALDSPGRRVNSCRISRSPCSASLRQRRSSCLSACDGPRPNHLRKAATNPIRWFLTLARSDRKLPVPHPAAPETVTGSCHGTDAPCQVPNVSHQMQARQRERDVHQTERVAPGEAGRGAPA